VFGPRYYNYYLEGIRQLFPYRELIIDGGPFNGWVGPRDGMAVIVGGAHSLRMYFQASDVGEIYRRELRWADAYGVVNLNPVDLEELPYRQARKVVPLGPSFGIKALGGLNAVVAAVKDLPKAVREGLPRHSWRRYVGERRGQARRLELSEYGTSEPDPDYVFFASRWWPDSEEALNATRLRFVEACLDNPAVRFEGGFNGARIAGLPEELSFKRRYSTEEYISRIRRSALVFNTPAVHGCHGWKLGEYLAMGKAILSLPLSWDMPAPLRHGEEVHYVADAASIDDAVTALMSDREYREHIGRGARRYWDDHLAPLVQACRMVERAEALAADRDPVTLLPAPPPRTTLRLRSLIGA
jgi:glycosyltransferase involved in cell wall biosynthesis